MCCKFCSYFFNFLLKLWVFIVSLILFGYLGKLVAWLLKGISLHDVLTDVYFWIPDEQFWFWAATIMLGLLMGVGCVALLYRGICASCDAKTRAKGDSDNLSLIRAAASVRG